MQDWAAETATLDFQLKRLGATLETIGTQFGKDVLPVVTEGVKLFTDFLGAISKNKAEIVALGGVITAILVPAIGLYLKGALLSSSGAIMSVLRAYQRLIFGQTEEQVALGRMDASLGVNDAALQANAGALTSDSAAATRTGGLAGIGGGTMGVLGRLGLGALGGYMAGQIIRGNAGSSLSTRQTNTANVRTLLGDVGEGAILGGTVGSVIPGVGTLLGGALGGLGGAIYGGHTQITGALTHGWDDLFGGSPAPPPRTRAHIVAHVSIDGKDVTATVKQNVKRTAARK